MIGLGVGLAAGRQTSALLTREAFIVDVLAIAGTARLLMLPRTTDTTTSADESGAGHAITHNVTAAGRLTAQGNGALLSYASASSQYTDTPDAADLSFGNGTTDQPFTLAFFGSVTNTAAERCLISKFNAAGSREYRLNVAADDTLVCLIADDSVPAQPFVQSTAAIAMGAPSLIAATYSGAGGASAHLGLSLYQNGAALAATQTQAATYVAMENLGPAFEIGSRTAHTANFLDGSVGMVLACQKALTAAEHATLYAMCRRFFGA